MSATLKPEELAAIRARAATAPKGPWSAGEKPYTFPHEVFIAADMPFVELTQDARGRAAAAFIAAARTDIPALLDHIVDLEMRIASLEARPLSAPPSPPGGRGPVLRDVDYLGHNAVAMPQLSTNLATQQAHNSGDHAGCALDWCAYATLPAPSAEAGIESEDGAA